MKDRKSYIFTRDKGTCTGCSACVHVCPHEALSMSEDDEGFLFPILSEDKCINCGLCDLSCPVINHRFSNNNYIQQYYVAASKQHCYTLDSATIGLCTMMAEEMLDRKGHVFAVVLEPDSFIVHHVHIIDKSSLMRTKNSKYAQSHIDDSYTKIKSLLSTGEKVLFIGTPCQVAGLKAVLKKSYDSLYTIDLICHGVYSYRLLQKEIAFWEQKYHGKIINFRFRSKRKYGYACGGMINFDLVIDNKLTHIERPGCSSPIYAAYAYNKFKQPFNLRLSCYNCQFREDMRYGDMTIGDSRGTQRYYKEIDNIWNYYYGTTIFSINSLQAEEMFKWVKHRINVASIDRIHFFNQNALRQVNRQVPEGRKSIYNATYSDYESILERILDVCFDKEMKKWRKKMRKQNIKNFFKYILLLKW